MSLESMSANTSISILEKNKISAIFEKFDRNYARSICYYDCILALQEFSGHKFKEGDEVLKGYNRESQISNKVFYKMALKTKEQLYQNLDKLEEEFLVRHFSKNEIEIFISEWKKQDIESNGFMPLSNAQVAIENILSYYQKSDFEDPLIHQFIKSKKLNSLYFEELLNFISKLIRNHSYKFSGHKRCSKEQCPCAIF